MIAAAGPVIVQLLIDCGAGLACKMRKVRRDGNALLAMTSDANFQDFGTTSLRIGISENLKDVWCPGHLRNRRRRRTIYNLLPSGRAGKNADRSADCRIGVQSGTAALHDRNDDDAEQYPAQHDGDNGNARPYPPWLIENMRLGNGCVRHLSAPTALDERSRSVTARSRIVPADNRKPIASGRAPRRSTAQNH